MDGGSTRLIDTSKCLIARKVRFSSHLARCLSAFGVWGAIFNRFAQRSAHLVCAANVAHVLQYVPSVRLRQFLLSMGVHDRQAKASAANRTS